MGVYDRRRVKEGRGAGGAAADEHPMGEGHTAKNLT